MAGWKYTNIFVALVMGILIGLWSARFFSDQDDQRRPLRPERSSPDGEDPIRSRPARTSGSEKDLQGVERLPARDREERLASTSTAVDDAETETAEVETVDEGEFALDAIEEKLALRLEIKRPLLLKMPEALDRLSRRAAEIGLYLGSADKGLDYLVFELENGGKWEMRHVSDFWSIIGTEKKDELERIFREAPVQPTDPDGEMFKSESAYRKYFKDLDLAFLPAWDRFVRPGPWTVSPPPVDRRAVEEETYKALRRHFGKPEEN